MISHADIWRGLDRLADAFGYSPSGLAKKAGLDPTSFNKSKRVSPDGKPRWPSTESLSKVLSVTGATMSDFMALLDGEAEKSQKSSAARPRSIPVIGLAKAGNKGYFDQEGHPAGNGWDEISFPDAKNAKDSNLYALEVSGDSMEPLFRNGDLLIVSPSANVRRGDRVIVKTRRGEVMAKELARQNASRIELSSMNPAYENRELAKEDVAWMARIMWVRQ